MPTINRSCTTATEPSPRPSPRASEASRCGGTPAVVGVRPMRLRQATTEHRANQGTDNQVNTVHDDDGRQAVAIGEVAQCLLFSVKSIPTTYNGVRFRSRLEARWAAFFDLAVWKWEYEPFDMDGWAPDFLIYGAHLNTLVEVKPAVWDAGKLPTALFAKAMKKDDGPSILLLGVSPHVSPEYNHVMLGMCNQPGEPCGFDLAPVQKSEGVAKFGFCNASQGFTDRISGRYNGGSWDGDGDVVMELWRQAGNAVQWRAK